MITQSTQVFSAKPEKKHKMLQLNKRTKTKPKPALIFKNCSLCVRIYCTTVHTQDSTEQFC